jgi:hypothetical protein
MDDEQSSIPLFPVPDLDLAALRIDPHIDFAKAQPSAETAAGRPASPDDALEEIAEDMEDVVQRLGRLERQGQETVSAVTALRDVVGEHSSYLYRLVESVRNDLVENRKGLALRSVFEPMALALDQFEAIRKGFDPEHEQAAYGQVSAAMSTVSNLLQSFGFTRFAPAPGVPFDAARMQCLGYAPGQPGVVLQVLRPGYTMGETLARPAGVLIANPERKADAGPASNEGEEESCTE